MISVVIPTYNEEENVAILYKEIKEALDTLKEDYEIVYVEDGSSDKTFENLKVLHAKDKKVKVVKFLKNSGQTAAMDAGFKFASGDIIIAMDADLQNDPQDIPRLISKMNEGYDCVSGWRANRKDSFSKKIFSRVSYLLRKSLLRDGVHDSGCTLKAYRNKCFEGFDLYSDMHRFIPALLKTKGFKITELKVNHRQRKFGQTKYGLKRLFKGFSDLMKVHSLMKHPNKFKSREKASYNIEKTLK